MNIKITKLESYNTKSQNRYLDFVKNMLSNFRIFFISKRFTGEELKNEYNV